MKIIAVLLLIKLGSLITKQNDLFDQDYSSVGKMIVSTNQTNNICNGVKGTTKSYEKFCLEQCLKLVEMCEKEENILKCVAKVKAFDVNYNLFFKRCKFAQKFQESIEGFENVILNGCFITRAVYRDSWVNEETNSCNCALLNAEPCTLEDVNTVPENVIEEIKGSGICPNIEYGNLVKDNKSIYGVSISNNKQLHCTIINKSTNNENLEIENRPIVSDLNQEELVNYCKRGPVYSSYTKNNTQDGEYNCAFVKSLSGDSDNSCIDLCEEIEEHCDQFDSNLIKCIKDRLTVQDEREQFEKYKCQIGEEKGLNELCKEVYNASDNKDECLYLCNFSKDVCQTYTNSTKNLCKHSLFTTGDKINEFKFNEIKEKVDKFGEMCKFEKGNYLGFGYVLCKYKNENCIFGEWSDWSNCNYNCIDFDHIPTRYRTRKLLNPIPDCNRNGLGTIEFQICTHLPKCPQSGWITTSILTKPLITSISKDNRVNNDKDKSKNYPEWIFYALEQYPDLISNTSKTTNNGILDKGSAVTSKQLTKTTSNKKGVEWEIRKSIRVTTIKETKCGCPKKVESIKFNEFIENEKLISELSQLCRKNIFNQLVFESSGRYIYYCNIGILIKEVENKHIKCEEEDSTEYIICKKVVKRVKKEQIAIPAIIGILGVLGLIIIVDQINNYYNRKSFHRISNIIPLIRLPGLRASQLKYSTHDHHHHEEPPHYAYRGDGLPGVKCEQLQHMLHLNQKLTEKLEKSNKTYENLGFQTYTDTVRSETADNLLDVQSEEVYYELKNLFNKVLLSNWHDTVQLTMNMDIWAGSFDRLWRLARDIPHVRFQQLLTETKELFDVLYQVEDLQDHLYELMEELALHPQENSGSSMGATTNYNQHINEVVRRYHELKRNHPQYTQKLKESLGYTLAVMRQRYTFDWPEEHSYFY
uniref:DUF6827 domain-containing protein n=1 Tax=Theileria annulata TaxID=5874 RepID=A0A3B0MNM3_THEAN